MLSTAMPGTPESLLTTGSEVMTHPEVPGGQENSASRLEDPLAGIGFLDRFVLRLALYGATETAYMTETPQVLLENLRKGLLTNQTAIRVRQELQSNQSAGTQL